jgi:hypothetical protein
MMLSDRRYLTTSFVTAAVDGMLRFEYHNRAREYDLATGTWKTKDVVFQLKVLTRNSIDNVGPPRSVLRPDGERRLIAGNASELPERTGGPLARLRGHRTDDTDINAKDVANRTELSRFLLGLHRPLRAQRSLANAIYVLRQSPHLIRGCRSKRLKDRQHRRLIAGNAPGLPQRTASRSQDFEGTGLTTPISRRKT